MTAFTSPKNPKLGVLASPAEWRERLESLPDLKATDGKIPSFYCKPVIPVFIREVELLLIGSISSLVAHGRRYCLKLLSVWTFALNQIV